MAEPEAGHPQVGAELAADCDRAAAEAAISAQSARLSRVAGRATRRPVGEAGDRGCRASRADALIGGADESLTDLTEIVATNVFHRAVVFGHPVAGVPVSGVVARVAFNGEAFGEAAPLEATLDPVEVVGLIARIIGTGGERLRPGDIIIGGSLVPPPVVGAGDELALDLGPLGSLSRGNVQATPPWTDVTVACGA